MGGWAGVITGTSVTAVALAQHSKVPCSSWSAVGQQSVSGFQCDTGGCVVCKGAVALSEGASLCSAVWPIVGHVCEWFKYQMACLV